jgi:DNA-binding HxlR family transcriptional regulator
VEYRLTPKGVALAAVVAEIERWVATWEPEGGATAATAAARRPPGGRSAGG